MKNSAVLASLLFGALAVAAPFDKRALVFKTEVVTETVVIYTTVYEDEPATTSSAGVFYEQPTTAASAVVEATLTSSSSSTATPTPTSTYTPPVTSSKVEEPSSTYTPIPSPTTTLAPAPEPTTTEAATPTTTEETTTVPTTTAAATSVAAAAATGSSSTGEEYSNVDITIYQTEGGYGACGTQLQDTDMIVAIAEAAWGASTYDVATGAATNAWCGKKIQIEYNGNTVPATIMDMCPGCSGHDIDLSPATWKAVTGSDVETRYKASWSVIG